MTDTPVLAGRRALVTGGCRGIGAAISTALAASGAQVTTHGRGDERSRQFAAEHGFEYLTADFGDLDEVRRLADAVAETGLDILVNNAGMEVHATAEQLDPAELSRQLRVNLETPILLTHLLIPTLKASRHGSVINVTSIHGTVPAYANSVYCAAKAGMEAFTRTLAIELGSAGVRVNAIAPGAIGHDRFAEWIPLGRVGDVQDIAGPAVFLASDDSSYVSGAVLVVDGAYSHHLVRYRL
jgi:NAD(P)-dependent dehydrogenase (short-subunit alcohol dehydrogenase family)